AHRVLPRGQRARERLHRDQRPGRAGGALRGAAGGGGRRARRPGLRRGAPLRDAADRRPGARDRPARHGADRPRHDPRRRPVSRAAAQVGIGAQWSAWERRYPRLQSGAGASLLRLFSEECRDWMSSTLAASSSRPAARGNARLRALDRTAGMAVLAAAGALKRRRSLPAEIRRIGIMKSTGIGDMTLLAGVARDVAAAYPDATVVLVAGRDNADVARLVGGVEVVTVPIGEPLETIRRLRALELDVLLDFGQWTRVEALCTFLSGARYT